MSLRLYPKAEGRVAIPDQTLRQASKGDIVRPCSAYYATSTSPPNVVSWRGGGSLSREGDFNVSKGMPTAKAETVCVILRMTIVIGDQNVFGTIGSARE